MPTTPLIRVEDSTFNTRPSGDLEADVVVVLGPPNEPAHAIVVEIQHDKSKDPKQLARYAAALWLLLRCDVTVLVVCPDRGVAAHYAAPVDSGLIGYRLHPHVLGPDDIPVITDPHEASAQPALSALAVMAHGRIRKVIEAFAMALAELHDEHAPKYYEYAYSMAAPDIRRLLEEIMKSTAWPVYSPFAREHYGRGLEDGQTQGKAEGRAEEAARVVLLLLETRGFALPDDIRARITACTDLDRLETWATRAVTAQTLDDVLADSEDQRR
ncbi:hypothetical protein ACQEUU_29245 [Nonomuraea sp. CA-218870]|uniref:hypothetical protein n=1 Tax=Nonomuraea sp. CA-218870 TaxID=3239998 RepID=UPI003D8B8655